jgi:uncharacterized protein YbjT (DUF2867 family)
MILVVGATGLLGSEICGQLAARDKRVRVLARATSDPAKVDRLRALGAEIVPGDLRDADSLRAACQGVSTIITTAVSLPTAYQPGANSPQITDRDGYLSLIAAARDADVQRFVYTSFPPMAHSFPLQDARRAVEAGLRSSGLTYTILQPTFFGEVWLSPALGFDYPNRKATIYGDGTNAISWISYRDVAQLAVAALGNPAAFDATIELGGPQALSPTEAISIFERVGGRPFEVTHIPVQALRGQPIQTLMEENTMKKTLFLVLVLLAVVLAGTVYADTGVTWVFPIADGETFNVPAGDSITLEWLWLAVNKGLVNTFRGGFEASYTIYDAAGAPVWGLNTANADAYWGPIEQTDPADWDIQCAMPQHYITDWLVEGIRLAPGSYTLVTEWAQKRPINDGWHVCRDVNTGEPLASGIWTVTIVVQGP